MAKREIVDIPNGWPKPKWWQIWRRLWNWRHPVPTASATVEFWDFKDMEIFIDTTLGHRAEEDGSGVYCNVCDKIFEMEVGQGGCEHLQKMTERWSDGKA